MAPVAADDNIRRHDLARREGDAGSFAVWVHADDLAPAAQDRAMFRGRLREDAPEIRVLEATGGRARSVLRAARER